MNDPMRYQRFAHHLAWRYGGIHSLLERDDVFQTAMIGAMELLAKLPDATESLCLTSMKYAVYTELRRQQSRPVDYLRDYEQETITHVEEDALSSVGVEEIGAVLARLPDRQFHALCLQLMGYNLMEVERSEGLPQRLLLRSAHLARQRVREWLREREASA